jgi:hypothetical protein
MDLKSSIDKAGWQNPRRYCADHLPFVTGTVSERTLSSARTASALCDEAGRLEKYAMLLAKRGYMKKILFFIGITSLLILTGCHHNDTVGPSPFSGQWHVIFYGPYTEGGVLNVGSDGAISGTITLMDPDHNSLVVALNGTVSSSGGFFGRIIFNHNEVGTMDGHLDKDSGSGDGIYMSRNQSITGTWTASLQ